MRVQFVACALKYYPNLATGEFVNVGVLLVCPEAKWWGASFATELKAINRVFPSAQPQALIASLRRIERRVQSAREHGELKLELAKPWDSIFEPIQRLIGSLSGSLRWAEKPISGLTDNPDRELRYWFRELVQVGRHEDDGVVIAPRAEEKIRFLMRHEFERRGLLSRLYPSEVGGASKELFDYTFERSGVHVFENINLNFVRPGSVKSHAQLWRGKLDSIADGLDVPLSFYALVDVPKKPRTSDVAAEGLEVIERANVTHVQTFTLDQVDDFGRVAEDVIDG